MVIISNRFADTGSDLNGINEYTKWYSKSSIPPLHIIQDFIILAIPATFPQHFRGIKQYGKPCLTKKSARVTCICLWIRAYFEVLI